MPWEGFWTKKIVAKKKVKKSGRAGWYKGPSAGHADPGKEGFGSLEGKDKPGLARPWPTLKGWAGGLRQDVPQERQEIRHACCAAARGGLFALRVTRRGHLEAENFGALKL